jgi:signal transduction histidine kinase
LYLNSKKSFQFSAFIFYFLFPLPILISAYLIHSGFYTEFILLSLATSTSIIIEPKNFKKIMAYTFYILSLAIVIVYFEFSNKGSYYLSEKESSSLALLTFSLSSISLMLIFKVFVAKMEDYFDEYTSDLDKIQLQSRLADLGNLSSGIAHQINSPLAAISGYHKYYLNKDNKSVDLQTKSQIISQAQKEAERLRLTVRGIHLLSRDPSEDHFADFDLNDVFEPALSVTRQKLKIERISVIIHKNKKPIIAHGNRVQIAQTFLHLIHQAEYSLQKTKNPTLEITAKEAHGRGYLSILHNGEKIPEIDLPKIFLPLQELSSESIGLGLSLSKEIMLNHKGGITCSSVDNQTIFTLEFPLNDQG